MATNAWTGGFEDDMRAFFVGRNPWDVSAGDIWRWRAACEALRMIDQQIKEQS